MKYLLILTAFLACTSLSQAQTYKVKQCLIENGVLKTVDSDYDPATGIYSLTINGAKKSFDEIYPPAGREYAASATWYKNNDTISLNGQRYIKYGLPRVLGTNEIEKAWTYKNIGVYVEAGYKSTTEVIYIPVRRGCEFQPYQKLVIKTGRQKIYYDENWLVTNESNAAYYRLVTINSAGKPVGPVKDFYFTGELQWEGTLSYLDPVDNNKDVTEGVCTWYHRNGKKSARVTKVHGKEHGLYRFWSEEGYLQEEVQYKNGLMHGYRKVYSSNGKLISVENYINGELDSN